jgi:hypothetical protein
MDMDSELARAKWLLVSGALFLVSCFICYSELIYLLRGKQIHANVANVYEVHRGRFGQRMMLTVEYSFTEPDGRRRSGSAIVNPDWEAPANGMVVVQYTPGSDGRSRLAGDVNWFGIAFFVASVGVLGFFGYRLWREASEAVRPARSKRRK